MRIPPSRLLSRWATLIWVGLLLAYVLLQIGRAHGLRGTILDWYLTDVICLPLVLGLILAVQRWYRRAPAWLLPRWHGLVAAVAYAAWFEAALHHFRASAVGDARDALSYLVGWLLFEILINRPAQKSRAPKNAAFPSV